MKPLDETQQLWRVGLGVSLLSFAFGVYFATTADTNGETNIIRLVLGVALIVSSPAAIVLFFRRL